MSRINANGLNTVEITKAIFYILQIKYFTYLLAQICKPMNIAHIKLRGFEEIDREVSALFIFVSILHN